MNILNLSLLQFQEHIYETLIRLPKVCVKSFLWCFGAQTYFFELCKYPFNIQGKSQFYLFQIAQCSLWQFLGRLTLIILDLAGYTKQTFTNIQLTAALTCSSEQEFGCHLSGINVFMYIYLVQKHSLQGLFNPIPTGCCHVMLIYG